MQPLFQAEPGVVPMLHATQGRWKSIASIPSVDAVIDFDLRAAVPDSDDVVFQPLWLAAAYGALTKKRGNYELQIGAYFPYDRCPGLAQASATGMIEQAWLACKPLVEIVRDNP